MADCDHILEPATIHVASAPGRIATVVGAGVAECLWDRRRRVGGMNHFLYPVVRIASAATPHYGNAATLGLLKLVIGSGSQQADLEAHVYGGACPQWAQAPAFIQHNVEMADSILARRGIHVVSRDVGGELGRKLVLDLGTGEVAVHKGHRLRDTDWVLENRVPGAQPWTA